VSGGIRHCNDFSVWAGNLLRRTSQGTGTAGGDPTRPERRDAYRHRNGQKRGCALRTLKQPEHGALLGAQLLAHVALEN
jgi:hypothetical protein